MRAIILTVSIMIGMTLSAQVNGLENYKTVDISINGYSTIRSYVPVLDAYIFKIDSDTYPSEESISMVIEELERILEANGMTLDSYSSTSTDGVELNSIDISVKQAFITGIFFDYVIGDKTISFITRDLNEVDQDGYTTMLMIYNTSMYE